MMFRIFGKKTSQGPGGSEKGIVPQEKSSDSITQAAELHMYNRDTKIAEILKREFPDIARKEKEGKLRLLFVGLGEKHGPNIASLIQRWEVPKGFATFVAETGAETSFLKAHGYNATNINVELYPVGTEESDVVFVLDKNIKPTHKFLQNVERGGYLVCRTDMAASAMQSGKFDFKGILTVSGGEWTHVESKEYDTVQTNEQFEKAQAQHVQGTVSYREAEKTLRALGKPADNVLEEYKELIEEIRTSEEHGAAFKRGETIFKLPGLNGFSVEVNSTLPRMNGTNDDIFTLKKKPDAL